MELLRERERGEGCMCIRISQNIYYFSKQSGEGTCSSSKMERAIPFSLFTVSLIYQIINGFNLLMFYEIFQTTKIKTNN